MSLSSKRVGVLGIACLLVATGLAAAACGGSGGDAADGGGGGGDGGGSGGDGGGGGGDGGVTGKYTAAMGTTLTKYAQGMATIAQHAEYASFYLTPPAAGLPINCTGTTDGACSAVECVLGDAGAGDAGVQYLSAGLVSMSGGTTPVMLTRAAGGTYSAQGMGALWTGGAMLKMTTTGDMAGVATPLDIGVVAPHQVTVTTPQIMGLSPIAVSRAQPFPVAWTGGAEGTVRVSFGELVAGRSRAISCEFPASSGSGSIPTSMLSKLTPTGDAGGPGLGGTVFSVTVLSRAEKLIGDVGTSFVATTNGLTPSGANAAILAVVQ
jgi:hypothetical protein